MQSPLVVGDIIHHVNEHGRRVRYRVEARYTHNRRLCWELHDLDSGRHLFVSVEELSAMFGALRETADAH